MNQERIPVLSYAFIGITSLVLAYATFLDKAPDNETDNESATTMLPDVFSKTPVPEINTTESEKVTPINNIIPTAPPPLENEKTETSNNDLEKKPAVGGKTKRNKKTRRNTKHKKH
jgi:hypothetical protein